MCLRSTEPPLLPNPCYRFVLLLCRVVVCPCCSVHVRWLGSSFAFFLFGFSVGKKCKCATKSVGYNSLNSSFVSLISCCLTVNKLFVKALATCHIKTGGTALPIALYCLFSETLSSLKLSGKD